MMSFVRFCRLVLHLFLVMLLGYIIADALRAPEPVERGAPVLIDLPLPADELSELADQPTLAYGAIPRDACDPHTWPEWHRKRAAVAAAHPMCQWSGCGEKGKFIHHGVPVSFVMEAGYPEMVYQEVHGQTFWALCHRHHLEAHLIGVVPRGSYAATFDPNIAESCRCGRSVGVWPFSSRHDVVDWIRDGSRPVKSLVAP